MAMKVTNQITWLGTPESRILSIRQFRKQIDKMPFEDAVKLTVDNWSSGPTVHNLKFDISKVEEWPTPWDLFGQSTFCSNSQALGTFYTLLLSEHAKEHDIKLAIIEDVITGERPAIVFDNPPLTEFTVSSIISSNDIKNKLGVD